MRTRRHPVKARKARELFRPRDKRSTYYRRHESRPYARRMSREQDKLTPRQRFTRLVSADLDRRMTEQGWTVSRFIAETGVGRATIYEWLKTDSERMPKPEKVRMYAVNLGEAYGPYASALGWSTSPDDVPRDLEKFIERARRLAAHPGTSEERRRVLEARIKSAEEARRAAEQMERMAEELLREALGEGQSDR